MFLHKIQLNPRSREVRRDIADPYQLHSTLCRALLGPESKCPPSEFLWRLEPESDQSGRPRILVQSRGLPDWASLPIGWLDEAEPAIDLRDRLQLDTIKAGQRFRFRLRANPCVTRNGKRLGLLRREEQEAWLARKGERHGFSLPQSASVDFSGHSTTGADVWISEEIMLRGRQHSGNGIRIFSALYDGFLRVAESEAFRITLQTGIGHGKALGLGLLSVAPVRYE